jgi:hypothetical protein
MATARSFRILYCVLRLQDKLADMDRSLSATPLFSRQLGSPTDYGSFDDSGAC